jgi:glutamate synthase (NADPH) large chain
LSSITSFAANGLSIVGWRDVPVDESVLGILSKDFVPTIRQVVMKADTIMENEKDFDKHLYDLRREIMVSSTSDP